MGPLNSSYENKPDATTKKSNQVEKEKKDQQEGQKSSSGPGDSKKPKKSVSFPLNYRKKYNLGVNE